MARRGRDPGVPLLTHADKPFSERWGYSAYRQPEVPLPSEGEAQRDFVRTLRKTRLIKPEWRWTRVPAGDVADDKWAGVMVAMGLNPGWPDLIFASPKSRDVPARLHGMEWKRIGVGELRDEQDDLRTWFLANGWEWATVATSTEGFRALQGWGALRMRVNL
jgi:hypothetical protein